MLFSRHLPLVFGVASLTVFGWSLSAQAQTYDRDRLQLNQPAQPPERVVPMPGTSVTSATTLTTEPAAIPQLETTKIDNSQIAQVDSADVGRAVLGGSSYVGIAANIGLDGDTDLGDSNFAVISKIGLPANFSLRPSAVFGGDTVFLIPLTYDISLPGVDVIDAALPISPYIGGGVAIASGDDSQTDFLLTGGVDFPLTNQFTATAGVNVAFFDETSIGLLLGVGYNFPGF
ncbi:hypothetical protein C7Y66_16515 [Chroococcidiopsis sp. CCALA 051]|uniref:outer membrane protein n=1 Tax=Chroococcidiopsis sp. CCALA 051 TaxID=869949 RepID=UPI000D0D68B7|nr:hypothetical protein [Chroococcidiopsis sp. CCALA 051]MBE9016891.1 hypothetical protein [Chroococcidiopsidales cyanobacterium LEGE 13417]PSM48072.1 hypothetical protein C7Y66_16515 [Chroococcidiopsis sp. CCALA 051]